MADNKTKPTKVSVSEFLKALESESIKGIEDESHGKLWVKLMQDATGKNPHFIFGLDSRGRPLMRRK